MKANTNFNMGSRKAWLHYILPIKSLILSALVLTGIQTTLMSQVAQYTKPSIWFGAAAGANLNFYGGSTQQLNSDLTLLNAFHKGTGIGLYLAPLMEYHRPDTRLGFMLQVGYDNRKGKFKEIVTPCNCPADLKANISYISVEPSLIFAPFKSDFYLYGGPRIALNLTKSFTYNMITDPASAASTGDFSNTNKWILSMQIGAGYDIKVSSQDKQTQAVISPFVSFQPYFGQDPRSIETWNVTTLRFGAAIKFGRGHKNAAPAVAATQANVVAAPEPEVAFSINSPLNIPVERRVRETFPIRNYVFFDLRSTEIPDRYVLLTKDQVKDFKEDQLEVFTPKKLTGRSVREMTVYYNILNILGDRMGENPSATVRLTGSSMQGPEDGKAMAESVKRYLVSVFGIDPSRISTEGRVEPRIPSEQPGGTKDLDLLHESDRRVSILSTSPELLMEFQSGNDVPLRPVELLAVQEAPLDSYITINVKGANEAFLSWKLEIMDENGIVQNFGPYTQDNVSIPGKSILGVRPEGNFKVTMIGQTKSGKTIKKEASVHMVLWTPSEREEGMRYSIIFEFNDSKAIPVYEKYLTEIVTPKIPKDGTVIIHGHTDIIGDEAHNMELSLARANEVRGIIENALSKAGRTDVKFEVYGFGEDQSLAPFGNKFPEERFYNRTVIIDIVPPK
ncbi:MAG: OmpA family protein [Bacteroidales bacterium]|jgi:outer membrane protein OmpA-like peptidoglycan-associated protein